jgi:hypothetical protein
MAEVGVIWAGAPSLEKLENELARLLAGCSADDILGVSHSSAAVSSKQSGGIWGGAFQTLKLEYSAVVLVRNGQGDA